MKKLIMGLALVSGFIVSANAANLAAAELTAAGAGIPAGNYVGTLSEATSSWTWNTNVTGVADNNSKITVEIPSNPHLLYLKGTLTATVLINGNTCTSPDAQVKVGVATANVTFSNCAWNGQTITTDYKAAPILGVSIFGHATLSHS